MRKKIIFGLKFIKESFLFFITAGVVLTVAFCSLLQPGQLYSSRYGDYLPSAADFTVDDFLSGQFQLGLEQHLTGNLWQRDLLISAQSLSNSLLFKNESHGIAYGRDGYMFRVFYDFELDTLMSNLDAIDFFTYHAVSDVSLVIAPTANYPLKDYLPVGLPDIDQHFYINEMYRYLGSSVNTVNVADILASQAILPDSYIYYRTDPHWTSYGAWLAYSQFIVTHAGQKAFRYDPAQASHTTGFLGANYVTSKGLLARADEVTYFDFAATVTYPVLRGKNITVNGLYNYTLFDGRDQYAAFLHGIHPTAEIISEQSSSKLDTIVVICDSFGYSFIPFLTQNYNKIIMIDPRFYTGSFDELRETRYDDILILMNFESICADPSFAKLGV